MIYFCFKSSFISCKDNLNSYYCLLNKIHKYYNKRNKNFRRKLWKKIKK